MAIRRILKAPSFFLTKLKTKPIKLESVSDLRKAKKVATDLIDTLEATRGVGLAAIQINEHRRIIAVRPNLEKNITVMINPVIIEKSEELVDSDEACLSLPGLYGKVKRHKEITVTYFDINRNEITGTAYDLESFIIQHEIDHLNNILFIDLCKEVHDIRKEQSIPTS